MKSFVFFICVTAFTKTVLITESEHKEFHFAISEAFAMHSSRIAFVVTPPPPSFEMYIPLNVRVDAVESPSKGS